MYPFIKVHNLHSLNLYEGLDIIFEDITMLDFKVLKEVTETNKLVDIHLVPGILIINTIEEYISIVGYKLNESTYIVNCNGKGSLINISYKCSEKDIIKGIGYLYEIYKNRWNPKPYKPDE